MRSSSIVSSRLGRRWRRAQLNLLCYLRWGLLVEKESKGRESIKGERKAYISMDRRAGMWSDEFGREIFGEVSMFSFPSRPVILENKLNLWRAVWFGNLKYSMLTKTRNYTISQSWLLSLVLQWLSVCGSDLCSYSISTTSVQIISLRLKLLLRLRSSAFLCPATTKVSALLS
jgi:hypothetical protein